MILVDRHAESSTGTFANLSALHSLRAVWLMAQTAPEALGNVLSPWAI
jgi:hypothetical protein